MNESINSFMTAINEIGRGFCNFAGSMFIQSTVLILLLLIIDFLIRKRVRATFRYWIWMLVFIKLVLPPTLSSPTGIGNWFGEYFSTDSIVTNEPTNPVQYEPVAAGAIQEFAEPVIEPRIQPIPSAASAVPNPPITNATEAISAAPGLNALTWQGIVFLFWLVGVLVITVLLIQRIFFVKGLIAQSKSAEKRLADILDNCREQVGVRRNIRLRLSHNVTSPAVCGLFRPVILIPGTLLEKLSREKLQAILIHELAHIKRGDLWINCIQTFLQIAYFYNPFVWLANTVVRRIREQAVDEMVLVTLGDQAKSYSNTLIDIAEMAFSRPALSLRLVGVVESKKALSQRIKHILYRPLPKSAKLGIFGLIVIITIAAILLPMAKGETFGSWFEKDVLIKFQSKGPVSGTNTGSRDTETYSKNYNVSFKKGEKLAIIAELYQTGKPMRSLGAKIFSGSELPQKLSVILRKNYLNEDKTNIKHELTITLGEQNFRLNDIIVKTPFLYGNTRWGFCGSSEIKYSSVSKFRYLFILEGFKQINEPKSPRIWFPTNYVMLPGESNSYYILVNMLPLSQLDNVVINVPNTDEKIQLPNGTYLPPNASIEERKAVADDYLSSIKQALMKEQMSQLMIKADQEVNVIEAEPSPQKITATLPSDITVELVGLCREPVDDAEWWKPDGSEMPEPSFEANKRTLPMQGIPTQYTFLAKAQGGENVSMRMKIYEGSGWSTKVARDGTALCYVKHSGDSPPYHKDAFEKGPVEIGVAQGQWMKGRGPSSPNIQIHRSYLVGGNDQIVIQPPQAEKSSPDMATTFWATTSSKDYEYRLNCTLKDGSVLECMEPFFQSTDIIETGGLSNSMLNTISFNIDKPLDQIVNYELLYRKFEYARFNNVAFKPSLKTDVQVEVEGGEIEVEEENLQAKKIFLPDVDDKGLMLDLESGELVDVPKADTPEEIALALDKLKKGDIVFDKSALILVRGTTSPSLSGDITEPFKTYTIGQNLPEILNVRTKNNIEYTIEIQAIEKDGCQLEYYPVHPKHYVSASPLTTLEQTLVKQLLEMVRQVEEKYPDQATHWPEGPGIYHVDSKGKVTVWHYQKLRHRTNNDSEENEVGYGSSELVKATGMYYLPDGTPLQSRWRERGGGMKDIRVNIGRTLEDGEHVGLINRHDLPSDSDLLSRDGLERTIVLRSYRDLPLMVAVRIDKPLQLGSWDVGDIEADVQLLDDYNQITLSGLPDRSISTMLVTVRSLQGKEKEQIVLQANVFSINAPKSLIADYLREEFGVNNTAADLTEAQAVQFKKWISALPDITMISSPTAVVFDGEQADLSVTSQKEYTMDYEKTSDSPPQYKPKKGTVTTGVELFFVPALKKKDNLIILTVNLKQRDLEKIETKTHASGNQIQLPVINSSEIHTQVAVPVGKYFLISAAGLYSTENGSRPDQPAKQTILMIKADWLSKM